MAEKDEFHTWWTSKFIESAGTVKYRACRVAWVAGQLAAQEKAGKLDDEYELETVFVEAGDAGTTECARLMAEERLTDPSGPLHQNLERYHAIFVFYSAGSGGYTVLCAKKRLPR